ncbi:hypothetical protein SNO29_003972 [Cronobacter sakazakii]|nr:hypothetical protein [Cronobacter sakazakii]
MKKIKILLLSGFLGAGKTTTALKLISYLESKGLSAVYIANDQGSMLIDTGMGEGKGIATRQVGNGCFCCRFDDLMAVVQELIAEKQPDVIIAEAVGSCTDLVSTVIRPLKKFYGAMLEVLPFPVVLDGSRYTDMQRLLGTRLSYLFSKQIQDAQIICLSKADTIPENEKLDFTAELRCQYPGKPVVAYSSQTGAGMEELAETLIIAPALTVESLTSLEIDYDTYGAAEAEMAWVDVSLDLAAGEQLVSSAIWVRTCLDMVRKHPLLRDRVIGHIKLALVNGKTLTKASLVELHKDIQFDELSEEPAEAMVALINARVEGKPDEIYSLVEEAVMLTASQTGTHAIIRESNAFSPGMPSPVHRILQD